MFSRPFALRIAFYTFFVFFLSLFLFFSLFFFFFFFNDTATTEIYTLSLHDALPISTRRSPRRDATGARSTSLPRRQGHRRNLCPRPHPSHSRTVRRTPVRRQRPLGRSGEWCLPGLRPQIGRAHV